MKQFHKSARSKVQSLISQRQKLIDMQVNKKNEAMMRRIISKLQSLLDAYPYNTDAQMAAFLLKNKGDIYMLIPGSIPNAHSKELNALMHHAHKTVHGKQTQLQAS